MSHDIFTRALASAVLLVGTLSLFSFATPTVAASDKDAIGVVLSSRPEYGGLSQRGSEAIGAATAAFLDSRLFNVVERSMLDKVMDEKAFKGIIRDAEGASIGEALGLRWMGILDHSQERKTMPDGSIRESDEITVRMIDVATGQVLHVISSHTDDDSLEGRAQSVIKGRFRKELGRRDLGGFNVQGLMATYDCTFRGAGQRLLQNLLLTFPPEGYLIEFLGRKDVVVDLGQEDGLTPGDVLVAFTVSAPTLHPVTGEQVPGLENIEGRLKVIEVRDGMSICRVKSGRDALAIGSRVRFVPKEGAMDRLLGGR